MNTEDTATGPLATVPPDASARIPAIAHVVFGLGEHPEPFSLVQYLAIESCRRLLQPAVLLFHHDRLPYGMLWDVLRPHLTLVELDDTHDRRAARRARRTDPGSREHLRCDGIAILDALIGHGGMHLPLDTCFLRPLPDALLAESFVSGPDGSSPVLAEVGAPFALACRERLGNPVENRPESLADTIRALSTERRHDVRVLQERAIVRMPAPTSSGEPGSPNVQDATADPATLAVRLGHQPWRLGSGSSAEAPRGVTLTSLKEADTPFARLARPYLPDLDLW